MLETIIALDEEQLEREIAFAAGFADPDADAQAWLAMLREELAERQRRRREAEPPRARTPEPRATYNELVALAEDVAMGNAEYDSLSDRAIELLANAPERSIEDDFQDVAIRLRELNEAILNSDLDDEELRGQWATALDYFDRVHQEYGG